MASGTAGLYAASYPARFGEQSGSSHLVNTWIQEVTAARAAAQATLRTITSKPARTNDQIARLVANIQDLMRAFRAANLQRRPKSTDGSDSRSRTSRSPPPGPRR